MTGICLFVLDKDMQMVPIQVAKHIAKVKGIQRTDTHMAFRVLSKGDLSATYEGFE